MRALLLLPFLLGGCGGEPECTAEERASVIVTVLPNPPPADLVL